MIIITGTKWASHKKGEEDVDGLVSVGKHDACEREGDSEF